jgi:hypothetical protein
MWQPICAHDGIGLYTLPVAISSRLLALEITTENSKPNWIHGGHAVLTARLDIGETIIQSERLFLPKPTAFLVDYQGDIFLTYRPPKYFGHWILTAYAWLGDINQSGFALGNL